MQENGTPSGVSGEGSYLAGELRRRARSSSLTALDVLGLKKGLPDGLIQRALDEEEEQQRRRPKKMDLVHQESLRTALEVPGLRFRDAIKEEAYAMSWQTGHPLNHAVSVLTWIGLYLFTVASNSEFGSPIAFLWNHLHLNFIYLLSTVGLVLAGKKEPSTLYTNARLVLSFALGMGVMMIWLGSNLREDRLIDAVSKMAAKKTYALDRRLAGAGMVAAIVGELLAASTLRIRFPAVCASSVVMICEYMALLIYMGLKSSRLLSRVHLMQITVAVVMVISASLVVLTYRFKLELVSRQMFWLLTTGPDAKFPEYKESQLPFSQVVDMILRALPSLESLSVMPSARNAQRLLEESLTILASRGTMAPTTGAEADNSLIDVMLGKNVLQEVVDRNLTFHDGSDSSVCEASVQEPTTERLASTAESGYTMQEPGIRSPIQTPLWLHLPRAEPQRVGFADEPLSPSSPVLPWDPDKPPVGPGHENMVFCRYAMFEWIKRATVPPGVTAIDVGDYVEADLEYVADNWELEPVLDIDNVSRSFDPVMFVGLSHIIPMRRRGYLKCSLAVLRSFLWCISNLYVKNPYHNSFHAAQVGHEAVWLARQVMRSRMTDADRTHLLIAALAHDLGHPARTNGFLCAVGNALARLYNDQSVLEHYHCAMLFSVLGTAKFNVLAGLNRKEFFEFRQLCVRCILATDMSRHFEILGRARLRFSNHNLNIPDADSKGLIMELVIKAADLGHTAISWKYHQAWSDRVCQEFYLQGDDEKRRGLPISPLCNRDDSSITVHAKSQSSFIEHVVMPLFEQLVSLDTAGDIGRYCCTMLDKNKTNWDIVRHTGTLPG